MSILNTAYSGLNAFQRALDVTGNNITNATTKGYSRQTIQLTPTLTQKYGSSFIGTGVKIFSVDRNADQFANFQVRETLSAKSQYDAFYQQASQIDKLLSQDGVSLSSSMQTFFTAFGQLNNAPDDVAARGVVLKQSQLLSSQFNYLQTKLDQYQTNSTTQINESVKTMNRIAKDIAKLNQQLVANPDAPELLDQRDTLLNDLSEFSDLTVIPQSNGTVNVGFSTGEMLVTGTDQRDLVVSSNRSSSFGTKILLGGGADVTGKFGAGTIKGLLDFEQNVVGKSSQLMGQMAIGLAQKFNEQHALGVDMNNQLGTNYFTDFNSNILQSSRSFNNEGNTGTAVLRVAISDVSQLQVSDYNLTVVNAATHSYSLVRKSDGTTIPLTWDPLSSSSPATLTATATGDDSVEGMTITVDDITHLANQDKFTLTPTRGAARDFNTLISDIRGIALASPVRTSAAAANRGQANVALGTVFDTTRVQTNYTIEIDPNNANQYRVVDTDSNTYFPPESPPGTPVYDTLDPSGTTISIPPDWVASPGTPSLSYTVKLTGITSPGDQFNLSYNTGAVGDNRNGLLLAGVQQSTFFTGGTESLIDRYSNLVADVGSETSQAKLRAESADIIYKQAVDFQGSKSGVNLDEEAANLLKFKQAYEAAGKLMQISSQMMNIIFDILG